MIRRRFPLRCAGQATATLLFASLLPLNVSAQQLDHGAPPFESSLRPDLTGVWGTYRAGDSPSTGSQSAAPSLRPEAAARLEEYRQLVAPGQDTPGGFCLGYGMPGSMLASGGYPMEIVQHPDIILIVYEAHAEIRRIYLGEALPERDLFPDRNGYSVGRWEMGRLIVETTHLKAALDQRLYPHSNQATIVEEYELLVDEDGSQHLVATMTLVDPAFYTEPVVAEKRWTRMPDERLLPYECNEPAWEAHLEALREKASDSSR